MKSQAVNTLMSRVKFVSKTEEEVGDGTQWPIQVTLDQLAEIAYRVRVAEFEQGGSAEFTLTYGDPPTTDTLTLNSPIIPAPSDEQLVVRRNPFVDGLPGSQTTALLRGYYRFNNVKLEPWALPFFGAPYDVPNFAYKCQDVKTETGMWLPAWQALVNDQDSELLTGLTHYCTWADYAYTGKLPTHYGPYVSTSSDYTSGQFATLDATFIKSVAVVKSETSDSLNPLAPGAKLYIGCQLFIATVNYSLSTLKDATHTLPADTGSAPIHFRIKLANETVLKCPLYYKALEGATLTGGSDFTLKATKWWAYGQTWNAETGAQL